MSRRPPLRASLTLVSALAACAAPGDVPGLEDDEPPPALGSDRQEIIGGTEDTGDPAVVILGGFCTATLVSPRVVLTAAHCVADFIEAGNTEASYVGFGTESPFDPIIPIVDMAMHRLYDPPAFQAWDVAAVRLAEDAPAEIDPVPWNDIELTDADIGMVVRTIGYGVTDGAEQTGFGIKRQVSLTLDELSFNHIGVGTPGKNSCQGDSGGPTVGVLDGEERILGVTSFGSDECTDRSFMTRVDSMLDFIVPVVSAWDGPCQADGTCVEDGCATIDPDCDPCGFNDECGEDCEEPDFDCPVAGRAGEICEDKFDCETRNCVPAPDDDRLSYCTVTCDPARPLETCPAPLSLCVDGPDGPICAYNGPTKSAQGWTCTDGTECRSGACDADDGICVEECGDGDSCPDPYSCSGGYCTLGGGGDGGGCGCGAAGDPRAQLATLLIGLALLAALYLRRRTVR